LWRWRKQDGISCYSIQCHTWWPDISCSITVLFLRTFCRGICSLRLQYLLEAAVETSCYVQPVAVLDHAVTRSSRCIDWTDLRYSIIS
jgi:hypothetical protein